MVDRSWVSDYWVYCSAMQTSWCNYMYKNVKARKPSGCVKIFIFLPCFLLLPKTYRFLMLKVRHKVLQGNFGIWNIWIINTVCFMYSVWKTSFVQNVKQLRPPAFWPRPPFHTFLWMLCFFVYFFHTHKFYTLLFSRLLEFFKRYIKQSKLH